MKRWILAGTMLATSLVYNCGPAASPSCANDAECKRIDEKLHYCVRNRCVECVTKAACGPGLTCSLGRCVAR
jgi:hypothetical protein